MGMNLLIGVVNLCFLSTCSVFLQFGEFYLKMKPVVLINSFNQYFV